jgi:capsular exopolysaccharide synthesis family protein
VELHQYLSILVRRRRLVAVVFLVTLGTAVALTTLRPETYTAKTLLRVEPPTALVGGTVQADDIKYLDRLVNTYSQLATHPQTAGRVARELRLDSPPKVTFSQVANTNLVELGATVDDQAKAAPAVNRVASLLIAELQAIARGDEQAADRSFANRTRRLEQEKAAAQAETGALARDPSPAAEERRLLLRERVNATSQRLAAIREDHERYQSTLGANSRGVTQVSRADAPSGPDNRNIKLALALGFMLAAVVGPGMAFVAENLSRRFRTGEEIEESVQAPVLTAIPMADAASSRALFNSKSPAEEAFRRLRTNLLRSAFDDDGQIVATTQVILITSAHPGEGKSTVVANLGRSLAQSGKMTLLVDADLRRPVLHRFFSLHDQPGLSDVLREDALTKRLHPSQLLQPTSVPGLVLLAAGGAVDDAPELLGRPWFSTPLLGDLAGRFHYVLVDSPAVLSVPDALAICSNVSQVLLVAGSNVRRDALRLAHQDLLRAGASVLGIVVNGAGDPGMYPYLDYPARVEERAQAGH